MASMKKILVTLLLLSAVATTWGQPRYAQHAYTGELVLLDQRELNPHISRFLEPDPEREFQSGYPYGAGMPVTYADPSGAWLFERINAFVQRYTEALEQHALDWEATQAVDSAEKATEANVNSHIMIIVPTPTRKGAIAMLPKRATVNEELSTLRRLASRGLIMLDLPEMTPKEKEMERLSLLRRLEHYNTREFRTYFGNSTRDRTAQNRITSIDQQLFWSQQFPEDITQEQIDSAYLKWRKPESRKQYGSYASSWAIDSTEANVPMFFEPASTRFQMPENPARTLKRWMPIRNFLTGRWW